MGLAGWLLDVGSPAAQDHEPVFVDEFAYGPPDCQAGDAVLCCQLDLAGQLGAGCQPPGGDVGADVGGDLGPDVLGLGVVDPAAAVRWMAPCTGNRRISGPSTRSGAALGQLLGR
jgi:hypothetical protein